MPKKKKPGPNIWWRLFISLEIIIAVWLICEVVLRIVVEMPLQTDFYSSIPPQAVLQRQAEVGIRTTQGPGWAHLGWIADPAGETYVIETGEGALWYPVHTVEYGSCLLRESEGSGSYRVLAVSKNTGKKRLISKVDVHIPESTTPPVYRPVIAGEWQRLFQPIDSGYYVNDHAIYRDAGGRWRLAGITSKTDGDYNQEKYFATAVSQDMPPAGVMQESVPIADFSELAWAPHVISEQGTWHMFWSPHRLEHMTSKDGVSWGSRDTVMPAPYHKFFRDGMVIKVAGGQWLLYTTARGLFFSQVDVYQSFDLTYWQYIGTALLTGWGSERNSPFASTESPFVMEYKGRYYLSVTYNNDTFFWNGLLLPFKIWLGRESYNDTLVFSSDNPYDFGSYKGNGDAPTLVARLRTHAPEYIYVPEKDAWYITTCGWPWIASLTAGEVAIASLQWEALPQSEK
ncbi:MAG: hypothetical protein JW901_01130 [Dehalococcoidia bacterium]|nr:hypothetical protein [Dehalococcoidia bacterium]